jgi:hypothetical protein
MSEPFLEELMKLTLEHMTAMRTDDPPPLEHRFYWLSEYEER